MDGVTLISLNIEHDRNLHKVQNFLAQLQPQVILLQEVLRRDVHIFESILGYKCIFTGLGFVEVADKNEEIGLLTGSKLPILNSNVTYYFGTPEQLYLINLETIAKMARALIYIEIQHNNKKYLIANTHFTWTKDGHPTQQQRLDLNALLEIISTTPEIILCGDFNAPRGGEVFDTLARKFKDNIPQAITSTLDKNAHRAGHLNLVVDGLFSTPDFTVSNVAVISDVSDHCAIYAEVT